MKWITRERPKIDRIACPWLIKRFIDPDAEIIYVPYETIHEKAGEWGAVPFDVPGVEHTHYNDRCSFDYFLEKYGLKDPALDTIARIVRGADTDRHELAAECAGLWAISGGLSYNLIDDQELLRVGMLIYDALYSWAKHLQQVKHGQQPFEHLLLNIFHHYLQSQPGKGKKIPGWARELKEIIQDHIDTSLSLKEISKELDLSPSYLSREFSKYFENMSFGEYIRKRRIELAIDLMGNPAYSLTEISYLTGFSDQSHFTRIFKKTQGENPSTFRRKLQKGKTRSKS